MSTFRTVMSPTAAAFPIRHTNHLLCIGSCFTETIGGRLRDLRFPTSINPFGIVYNPISMAQCLTRLAQGNQPFGAADLVELGGLWHSWEHHGRFSKPTQAECLGEIQAAYADSVDFLKKTDRLLLTLGTAFVYRLKNSGKIVANCHKAPASFFEKEKLSPDQIETALTEALQPLLAANPALRLVLTVSPIRHLKDGFIENQRSKAALVLACEALCAKLERTQYFPSYELLLDDLRDYRFYESDMVHPNKTATDYIWTHFSDTFFAADTQTLNQRIEKIAAGFAHRPFNPDTPEHQLFLENLRARQAELERDLKKL